MFRTVVASCCRLSDIHHAAYGAVLLCSTVAKTQVGSIMTCTARSLDQRADELEELLRREKEAGVTPDPDLDAFMRAEVRTGKRESIVTDLIIKMLGLDVSSLRIQAACQLFEM